MRKITIILLLFVTIIFTAYSRPSKSALLKKIKNGEHYLSVKLLGSGYDKKFENGSWHYYFSQDFVKRWRSKKYKGVIIKYYGGLLYEKQGKRYVFLREQFGEQTFEGIKNPTVKDIKRLAENNTEKFLQNQYSSTVTIDKITLPEKPKWKYHTVDSVLFHANVILTEKKENKLTKTLYDASYTFLSKGFKKPWTKVLTASYKKIKEISRRELSEKEMKSIKTIEEKIQDKEAEKIMSALPEVDDIPKFLSGKQMTYYFHNILMSKSPDEVKAYFYKGMATKCFKKNTKVLTEQTKKWLDYIFEGEHLKAYREQHCLYPTPQHEEKNYVVFYDRTNRYLLRYVGVHEDDTWKLVEISWGAYKPNELAKIKNIKKNCQKKPDLTVRIPKQYKPGDKVNVQFTNGVFPYIIMKKDKNFEKYYIKPEGDPKGRGYWMPETQLSPRTGNNDSITNKSKSTVNTAPAKKYISFKIGDKVKVNENGVLLSGRIIRYASHKYLIKFDDSNHKDKWYRKKKLSK